MPFPQFFLKGLDLIVGGSGGAVEKYSDSNE